MTKNEYIMYQWLTLLGSFTILVSICAFIAGPERADAQPIPTPVLTPKPHTVMVVDQNQDVWIRESAQKYATKAKPESYLKYQLHCLANKESGHHTNKGTGDNGRALGMYQFHQPTWESFRKKMLNEGLITEIGDRTNDKQAIETTAWALSNGLENHWGPILRGGCK